MRKIIINGKNKISAECNSKKSNTKNVKKVAVIRKPNANTAFLIKDETCLRDWSEENKL